MSYPRRPREGGFSLVDLLVSIAISGIAFGAITATFTSLSRTYNAQEQIDEMQNNVRAAMDIITREIRLAGYLLTNTGLVAIPYNTAQLEVRADLNGDSDTSDQNEDITYSYNNANLRIDRIANSTNEVLAQNVDAFNFDYLDSNGNPTSTIADIRQIKITITGRTAGVDPNYSANGGYRTYTLTSLITPRNLAY